MTRKNLRYDGNTKPIEESSCQINWVHILSNQSLYIEAFKSLFLTLAKSDYNDVFLIAIFLNIFITRDAIVQKKIFKKIILATLASLTSIVEPLNDVWSHKFAIKFLNLIVYN